MRASDISFVAVVFKFTLPLNFYLNRCMRNDETEAILVKRVKSCVHFLLGSCEGCFAHPYHKPAGCRIFSYAFYDASRVFRNAFKHSGQTFRVLDHLWSARDICA